MTRAERTSAAAVPVILLVGAAIAWAGSQGSVASFGVPLFALAGAVSFGINWAAFVPAYLAQSERTFDLTGSLTYLGLVALALLGHGDPSPRSWLIAALVAAWAMRLGGFLFARVRADGSDGRFDRLKTSFPRFFMTWTLQGLWVYLTLSCGLAAMTSAVREPLGPAAAIGALVWTGGFLIEALADHQKRRFRADPANRDQFIKTGLWAWSRHPNYFGEISLWLGITLIALPVLSGWQFATLVSPLFVYILLTRISGVPLLEARGRKRWGEDPAYVAYLERTPRLLLRPPVTD
jgi:steroid 5-alpha reductase family enzyme